VPGGHQSRRASSCPPRPAAGPCRSTQTAFFAAAQSLFQGRLSAAQHALPHLVTLIKNAAPLPPRPRKEPLRQGLPGGGTPCRRGDAAHPSRTAGPSSRGGNRKRRRRGGTRRCPRSRSALHSAPRTAPPGKLQRGKHGRDDKLHKKR